MVQGPHMDLDETGQMAYKRHTTHEGPCLWLVTSRIAA